MSAPYLPNLEPFIAAGIDLKTGLPKKVASSCKMNLKEEIKKQLRIIDEQDACNRYLWENIAFNLTSQEIERMLYYKGQLCMFKFENDYFLLPYTLNFGLDVYARFAKATPIPLSVTGQEKPNKQLLEQFSSLDLNVVYDEKQIGKFAQENCCVLLHDYTKQCSQTIIPRQAVNDGILDVMSECIPFMRTKLILGTGVKGIRVNDADQAQSVADGSARLEKAAKEGEAYIPIVGTIEFQDLSSSSAGASSEYMLAMQSLDNYRLSTYGISNGGLFEKKAHELQSEQDINASASSPVLNDGLAIRENFCKIANAIWGTNMTVKIKEVKKESSSENEESKGEEYADNDDSTI